ncbi:uncharacterized protein LOC129573213 [Sitodiplosis mosellana]|uniref:uncharacterized protein LOC129573213 n=1 Tax=Sitodiplosis mosellana TaxID=263140 RepID=UPI002443E6ED|nr:uncharacterized protein LOC129573213 [Sitodiplosis mosellana]
MGKFHPVTSVELGCCGTKWQHSQCLRELVHKQNTPMCQSCGNEEVFRSNLQSNGIFVPERNAVELEQTIDVQCTPDSGNAVIDLNDSLSSLGMSTPNSCDTLSVATDVSTQRSQSIAGSVDDQDESEEEPPRKKARVHADYVFVRSFDNTKQAMDFIEREK